jgi:hypothetical protein
VALEVDLPGGGPLPASEVSLVRSLGEPARWRFLVAASRESWSGEEVARVRKALLEKPCRLKAAWREGGDVTLGPEAVAVGARWLLVKSLNYIEVEAEATWPSPKPDPFVPRRRVHKVRNMKDLVERFGHVAVPVRGLRAELEGIEFPDGERSSIVQDGQSDWTFFFHMLDQCRFLAKGSPAWLPLVLVGGVDEGQGTDGRWVVTPGLRRAYESWGAIGDRTIRFEDGHDKDGEPRIEFGQLADAARVPSFPSGTYPSAVDWRPRRAFDAGRWKSWRSMDLPRFTSAEGALVWRIEDRLHASGDVLAWETRTFAAPPEAEIVGPVEPARLRPWVGLGTVEQTSTDGPWIQVKLGGFESGEDELDVRLGTPYSGKDGKRGLHFVPENGTEVLVGWGGRFDQSVVLVGNARSEAAELPSPSVYLESEHTAQYADVHVKKIEDVVIDSDLAMEVKQETSVKSSRQLRVKADGADLKLSGGTVYTGRGF